MYAFDSRIRYSEIDHKERITLPGIINYFQDCSIFHSENIGFGVNRLKEEKRAWILSGWQVVVERYPALGEAVKVCTWPTGFKGAVGERNFLMLDAEGKKAATLGPIAHNPQEEGRLCQFHLGLYGPGEGEACKALRRGNRRLWHGGAS